MKTIRTSCEKKLVVSFDFSSSSKILEDLSLTNNLAKMWDLLLRVEMYLKPHVKKMRGEIYKFTGDGWILLFPEKVKGPDLVLFLEKLMEYCKNVLNSTVTPHLDSTPKRMGVTLGMDAGMLYGLKIWETKEYVGRAINVACRLQSAIKDKDEKPEYKLLVSKRVFNEFRKAFRNFRTFRVTRRLRNIAGGSKFECVKVLLLKRRL